MSLRMTFEYNQNGVCEIKPLVYLWEIFQDDGHVQRYIGQAKDGAK